MEGKERKERDSTRKWERQGKDKKERERGRKKGTKRTHG